VFAQEITWVSISADNSASRRWQRLSNVLLLTNGREPPADILPSLSLLPHAVRVAPVAPEHVSAVPALDAVLVDARRDLALARRLLQVLKAVPIQVPIIAIVSDGGWAAVSADWGVDDLILHTAGPAEVEARLRVAIGRRAHSITQLPDEIRSSGLVINESTYSARINGRALDLTFKEFELLKFLAQHPGRVFTRAQLLQEVWGYDYFGGTRTVDVHVRRLRAKLGAENEALIGTVRNVGYRFVPVKSNPAQSGPAAALPAPGGPDAGLSGPDAGLNGAASPAGADRSDASDTSDVPGASDEASAQNRQPPDWGTPSRASAAHADR
jgi:DNA-binding response OmpR family regulator